MGGSDQLGAIVGLVSQTLVVGEYPAQLRIVEVALVDERSNELPMDKLVVPLPTRADTLTKKRRDCGLETSVVTAIGTAVITAVDKFALGSL